MRNVLVALALVAGVTLAAVPPTAQATASCYFAPADNPNGPTYPQQREFVEAQSWWQDATTGDAFPGRHVHVGTCFPFNQFGSTLSGTVHLDWRVQLHNQPSTTTFIEAEIQIVTVTNNPVMVADLHPNVTCATGDCTYWFSADVNTALSDRDGLEEFRFLTKVQEANGNQQHTSTGWQARLSNGKPVNDYRGTGPFIEARGWYTNLNYTNARLKTVLPGATAVSGTWTTQWDLKPGSGGTPTTGYECDVDPNYHAIPPNHGVIVKQGSGQYSGSINVNTTQLTNGTHALVCRADSRATVGSANGTISGVEKISFNVQN